MAECDPHIVPPLAAGIATLFFAGVYSARCFWAVKWLTEVHQQLLKTPKRTVMALDFSLPAMCVSIFYQFLFNPAAAAQSGRIRRRGHELRAGEVQIALTGAFLGETQAPAKL
jgi:hypothetical protein